MNVQQLPCHLMLESNQPDARRTVKVLDTLRGCEVAFKCARTSADTEEVAHEWTLLNRFQSDCFVEPVEFGLTGSGHAYLTTVWVEGDSLSTFAKTRAAAEFLSVVQDALFGLSLIHRAGYLHGDIRPENLMIRREDDRFVSLWLDLEWAAEAGRLSAQMTLVGEHVLKPGEAGNPRSDLEVFGGMLRACLPDVSSEDRAVHDCLSAFAISLCDSHERDKLLDAEDARYLLWDIAKKYRAAAEPPRPQTGPPESIPNRNATRQWQSLMNRWAMSGLSTLVSITGPRGCGKTSFLDQAVSEPGLGGHPVLNLLGARRAAQMTHLLNSPDADPGDFWSRGERSPILVIDDTNVAPFFERFAGALPDGILTVVECHGADSAADPQMLSAHSAHESWSYPVFGDREWTKWVSGSI